MKKASIPIHAEASPSHGQNITCPAELLRTAPSKIARVLVYVRHFDTLNRFEAARKVGVNRKTAKRWRPSTWIKATPTRTFRRW